LKFIKN